MEASHLLKLPYTYTIVGETGNKKVIGGVAANNVIDPMVEKIIDEAIKLWQEIKDEQSVNNSIANTSG